MKNRIFLLFLTLIITFSQNELFAITEDDNYIDNQDVDVDEYLDECYGSLEIGGTTFYASRIVKELDEDMYWEFYRDEQRNAAENSIDYVEGELERMSPDEVINFEGGVTVRCIDDEEDEDEESVSGFAEVFE